MLLWKLVELLQERGVPVVHEHDYVAINTAQALITIETRPVYCDRGNFLVKVVPHGEFALEMDEQDGFPRYYFGPLACADEVAMWMRVRGILPYGTPTPTTGESNVRQQRR